MSRGYRYLQERGMESLVADREGRNWSCPLPDGVVATEPAERAWGEICALGKQRWGALTWELWFARAVAEGERSDALCVSVPSEKTRWIHRRYAKALGEMVREHTDYRGLFICDRSEP